MNAKLTNKAALEQRIRGLIAGTQKHSPNGSLTFGGATYTEAALVQLFQSLADALAPVDSAKANWQDALNNERNVQAKVLPVIRAYSTWLVASNGNAPSTLADYGLAPRKVPATQTADQKAAAAAKRAATRAARHTMGSQQKKSVKGTVTTTAAPAPSAAAAPVAQGGVASVPATPGASAPTAPRIATPGSAS